METVKADHFVNNLIEDDFGNVSAKFDLKGEIHTIRLNERVVRRGFTFFLLYTSFYYRHTTLNAIHYMTYCDDKKQLTVIKDY